MKIAFVDDQGKLLTTAYMDTEQHYASSGKVIVPIVLSNESISIGEDNNGDIAPFVLEDEVLYTAPFELSETATVTAYARLTNAFDYNGGYVESEVVTAIYTLNPEVGVENVELAALVYANNGMIYVETAEGNMVEVFTVQGQCIFAAEVTANVTAINALNSDVVLVRVNGNIVKVSVK